MCSYICGASQDTIGSVHCDSDMRSRCTVAKKFKQRANLSGVTWLSFFIYLFIYLLSVGSDRKEVFGGMKVFGLIIGKRLKTRPFSQHGGVGQ